MVGDLLVAVFRHVADRDPQVGRGRHVDVVEAHPVADDRATVAQALLVGPIEPADRTGHDRHGLSVDGELEAALDVHAARARVDDLEAVRLEAHALERDLAVDPVVDHHHARSAVRLRLLVRRSSHRLSPARGVTKPAS